MKRSTTDRWLAGVCGGIAESSQLPSLLIRIGWIVGTLLSFGIGFVLYVVIAVLTPEDEPPADAEATTPTAPQ